MTYVGRVHRIRLERADKRYEAPVWRTLVHPRLVKIALLRSAYPNAKELVVPDDRAN